MQLAVIGVSHKQLSLEERGVFSFTDTKQLEFSGLLLNEGIEQCVILSTCNRSEVYVSGTGHAPLQRQAADQFGQRKAGEHA